MTLSAPMFLQYIIATDPRNNQVYIPPLRFLSDIVRNNLYDFNKLLSTGPGFPENPNSSNNLNNQGFHALETAAAGATKGLSNFNPLTLSKQFAGQLAEYQPSSNDRQTMTPTLPDGNQLNMNPHPNLPGHVSVSTPSGMKVPINTANLLKGSLPQTGTAPEIPAATQTSAKTPEATATAPPGSQTSTTNDAQTPQTAPTTTNTDAAKVGQVQPAAAPPASVPAEKTT